MIFSSMSPDPSTILPELPAGASLLFIRLRSLGDILLSTPLYAAIKAWRPDLRISVLVEKPYNEILRHNPHVDQVVAVGSLNRSNWEKLQSRLSVLRSLRKSRFDCCINLHGGSTSAWLTALSRARYRVGHHQFRNAFSYNVRLQPDNPHAGKNKLHTVEHQIQWLRALGLPKAEIPPMTVVPDPDFHAAAQALLERAGLTPGSRYVVIQPTSRFYTKEWTPDGFAEIADFLKTRYGLPVVLTGGPGEERKLELVLEKSHSKPAILRRASLSELAWVLSNACLFVGNDSGPTHLAAALSIPIVVLFGSSNSVLWSPWKVPHRIVQNPFDCNPCPGYSCLVYHEPLCILSITASQVKSAIETLMEGPGSKITLGA
ncbi:MAG: putative lipopolysaccharide heptosyltransferase III [Terriglobia bacterium]